MMTLDDLFALHDPGRASRADPADLPDDAIAAMVDQAAPLVQQDASRASAVLAVLVGEARRRSLADLEATGSYLRARAEVNLGHLDAALELIDHARAVWMAAGSAMAAWRTDLGRMHVLDDLGRHRDAIAVGAEMVAALRSVDHDPADAELAAWLQAAAHENMGVGHGYLGDHAAALDAYEAAEHAYRSLGMAEDVPRPMANRGVELLELGRLRDAVETLRTAAAGFEEHGDLVSVARCHAYEARAHLLLGDFLAAATATELASGHLDHMDTSPDSVRTQMVRAQTLSSLNLHEESLELWDAVVPVLAGAGLRRDLAGAHYGRGIVLAGMGRTDDAWSAFGDAARLFDEVGATSMAAMAMLAKSELADDATGRALAAKALSVLVERGRPAELATAHIRMSRLAAPPGDAIAHLDAARQALAGHDLPEVEWQERHERGRTLRRLGDGDGARAALEEALSLIEAARATVAAEHHRQPFMARHEDVLQELVAAHLAAGEDAAAYAATTGARARTLLERLTGGIEVAAVTPIATLDDLYTELLHSPGHRAATLRDQARHLERMAVDDAGSLPVPGRHTSLPGSAASGLPVVTYQTLGEELLAFVEMGGELSVVRDLATEAEIGSLLARLEAQWRRFDDLGLTVRHHPHLLAAVLDLLQQLHLRLLAPLADVLDAESIVVVPNAAVANVPFAALHDGTCHLVERLCVTMTPSLAVSALAAARARRTYVRRLAVGVVDEATPQVRAELEAIAGAGPHVTVLADEAATVPALLADAAAHDVIHIACHGVHRPDNPLFSALRLSDRWLTAAEVAGMELDGQLVVLSACASGLQQRIGSGDEVSGLPRAFLAAGAGSVIVNLWQAADASAAELMAGLHRHLTTERPAEALRLAQLDLLASRPHPYHWAPAVVYGASLSKERT